MVINQILQLIFMIIYIFCWLHKRICKRLACIVQPLYVTTVNSASMHVQPPNVTILQPCKCNFVYPPYVTTVLSYAWFIRNDNKPLSIGCK